MLDQLLKLVGPPVVYAGGVITVLILVKLFGMRKAKGIASQMLDYITKSLQPTGAICAALMLMASQVAGATQLRIACTDGLHASAFPDRAKPVQHPLRTSFYPNRSRRAYWRIPHNA